MQYRLLSPCHRNILYQLEHINNSIPQNNPKMILHPNDRRKKKNNNRPPSINYIVDGTDVLLHQIVVLSTLMIFTVISNHFSIWSYASGQQIASNYIVCRERILKRKLRYVAQSVSALLIHIMWMYSMCVCVWQ